MSVKNLPRKEYKSVNVVVQGPDLEPIELRVREMTGPAVTDSIAEVGLVAAALLAKLGVEKLTPEAFKGVPINDLLVLPAIRDAAYNVMSRSSRCPVETLHEVDAEDSLALLAATVSVNNDFFMTLLSKFGLLGLIQKESPENLGTATPKTTPLDGSST